MRIGINSRKRLLDYLERAGYLRTSEVRNAMEEVNRENFVRPSDKYLAYDDTPLSIGQGQTISAPHMVAMMLEELNLKKTDNLLEVGSGCGYHAAVASRMASQVTTIERVTYLYELACENLEDFDNINGTLTAYSHGPTITKKYSPAYISNNFYVKRVWKKTLD